MPSLTSARALRYSSHPSHCTDGTPAISAPATAADGMPAAATLAGQEKRWSPLSYKKTCPRVNDETPAAWSGHGRGTQSSETGRAQASAGQCGRCDGRARVDGADGCGSGGPADPEGGWGGEPAPALTCSAKNASLTLTAGEPPAEARAYCARTSAE
eukprot:scaffold21562_cov101-Isochrysis_galbana.AAC.1